MAPSYADIAGGGLESRRGGGDIAEAQESKSQNNPPISATMTNCRQTTAKPAPR
jgi:hypothetical protein